MGGSSSSIVIINYNNQAPNPPTPNFIDTLLTWANNLVQGSPFPITGDPNKDMATLQTALKSIATSAFLNQYLYAFNGPDTSPPSANDAFIVPLTDFTNCAQNQISNIDQYVDNDVFVGGSPIPSWALTKMRSDLETWLQSVLEQPVIEGWQVTPYARFYTDPNGKNNIRVDSECLYTIIPALDQNGQPQIILFLEFVGVYYTVDPLFNLAMNPGNKTGPAALEPSAPSKDKSKTTTTTTTTTTITYGD